MDAILGVAGENLVTLEVPLKKRALEALEVAVKLAHTAQRELNDNPEDGGYILTSIAISAVQTFDPAVDPLALRHNLVGWFGPANVPNDLRFSWEGKGKKGDKAIVVDGATMVGDPSAWRGGLKGAPSAAIPEITPERGAELMQTQNTMAVADQAVMDVADLYKALGRIEATEFYRKISDVVAAQTFAEIRVGKKYKGLPYRDKDGITRRVGDFEEFCRVFLGKSYNRCLELSQNLHTLGPDLYESAERIGFKARDYQALKALPESEQEIVKTALAAESKEQVLDILQDLAARHQSERAAAKKQTEDLKADLDARDKVLADKGERLDKISMELEKLKSLPPNKRARLQLEQEQAAAERINTACVKAEGQINAFLSEVADVLALDELSITTTSHANNAVRFLCESLVDFLQIHNIDVDFAGMARPEWLREQAADDLGLKEGK